VTRPAGVALPFNNAGNPRRGLSWTRLPGRLEPCGGREPDRTFPVSGGVPGDAEPGTAAADHQQRVDLGAHATPRSIATRRHARIQSGLTNSTALGRGRPYDSRGGRSKPGTRRPANGHRPWPRGTMQATCTHRAGAGDGHGRGRAGRPLQASPAAGANVLTVDGDGDQDAVGGSGGKPCNAWTWIGRSCGFPIRPSAIVDPRFAGLVVGHEVVAAAFDRGRWAGGSGSGSATAATPAVLLLPTPDHRGDGVPAGSSPLSRAVLQQPTAAPADPHRPAVTWNHLTRRVTRTNHDGRSRC